MPEDPLRDESDQATAADRRAYPRSPVVVVEARCVSGADVFFGYAKNISRSGLFIGSPKHRPVGEEYDIRFQLPGDDRPFHCRCRVIWSRPFRQLSPSQTPGFGLNFLDLPQEDGVRIDAWVSRQPSSQKD